MPALNARKGDTASGLASLINRALPMFKRVSLGDVVYDLLNTVNAQTATIKALTAKLDADVGVTDTNYGATTGASALTTIAMPEAR